MLALGAAVSACAIVVREQRDANEKITEHRRARAAPAIYSPGNSKLNYQQKSVRGEIIMGKL